MEMDQKNGGSYTVKTVQGSEIKFSIMGKTLMPTDEKGNMAHVTIKDVYQRTELFIIDTVVMPPK